MYYFLSPSCDLCLLWPHSSCHASCDLLGASSQAGQPDSGRTTVHLRVHRWDTVIFISSESQASMRQKCGAEPWLQSSHPSFVPCRQRLESTTGWEKVSMQTLQRSLPTFTKHDRKQRCLSSKAAICQPEREKLVFVLLIKTPQLSQEEARGGAILYFCPDSEMVPLVTGRAVKLLAFLTWRGL